MCYDFGADGRGGQANVKAKIKLRMRGGEPAESIGESKWRCHRETMAFRFSADFRLAGAVVI